MDDPVLQKCKCKFKFKLFQVKFPEPIESKNKAISCKPYMLTKGVSCRPHPCHKGTQTDLPSTPALLPITLPVFMPVPMQMYCRPYPVPVRIDLLYDTLPLETVQDSLIKLDMKPCMHLVEISIIH